jgi:hypothetical protein
MNSYLKYLLIIVIITSNSKTYSQIKESVSKATLTFKDGTSQEGYIRDIELSKIDKDIKFKKNLSDKNYQSIKSDSLIKSIVLTNGEIYKTLEVKHPLTQETFNIFCALVAKGELSLYEAIHKETEFFVLEKKDRTYWLQKDELIDGELKVTKNRFKNNLYSAISDSKILESDIEFVEFNKKSILDVVNKYNTEKGSKTDITQVIKKPVLFLITGGGLGYQVADNKEWYLESKLRIFFPSFSKSFSLNTGLRYHHLDYKIASNFGTFTTYNYSLGTSLFEMPIEIQNNFLSGNFRPFGSLGLGISYLDIDFSEIPKNLNFESAKSQSLMILGDENGFGVNLIYSLGAEWNVMNNLILKGSYYSGRNGESIIFGIKYCLKLSK